MALSGSSRSFRMPLSAVIVAVSGASILALGQAPGGRGGWRGGPGLPGATPEQTQAVAAMNAALADPMSAVTAARTELTQAVFASVKNDAAITSALDKVRSAELALAQKRAEEFAKLQSGPNKLSAEQVAALIAAAGRGGGPPWPGARGGRAGN